MEHPEDPRCYLPPGDVADRSVSLWRTEFIKGMVETFGLEEMAFDQGALGNPQRRPTRCLTNLELGLQGLRDSRTSWPQPVRGEDPSVWPQGFRETLCSAIKSWNKAMETDATTKAMSAKERSEWKEHLNNNHFPYRRLFGLPTGFGNRPSSKKGGAQGRLRVELGCCRTACDEGCR